MKNKLKGYAGRDDLKQSVLKGSFSGSGIGSVEGGNKRMSAFGSSSFINSGRKNRKLRGLFESDSRKMNKSASMGGSTESNQNVYKRASSDDEDSEEDFEDDNFDIMDKSLS